MALITTEITPTLFKVPFTGPPDVARRGTTIARAECIYSTNSGSWPAAGVGNDKRLDIDMQLPVNFAYLCTDLSLQIRSPAGDLVYANNHGSVEFKPDPSTAGIAPDYRLLKSEFWSGSTIGYQGWNTTISAAYVASESNIVTTDASDDLGAYKNYGVDRLPTYLLFPYTDTKYQSSVTATINSPLDGDGAYSIYFFCRFVQYDISQAYDWAPNSPVI